MNSFRDRTLGWGLASVAVLGVGHSLLYALLARDGHRPTFTGGLPAAADRYYAVAAMYAIPLYFALMALAAAVSHRLAGPGTSVPFRTTFAALAPVYALPMLALFVLPDLGIYLVAGKDAMIAAMRWYAPLAPIVALVLATRVLRRRFALSLGHAFGAALAGFLAQAVPAAWLLR